MLFGTPVAFDTLLRHLATSGSTRISSGFAQSKTCFVTRSTLVTRAAEQIPKKDRNT